MKAKSKRTRIQLVKGNPFQAIPSPFIGARKAASKAPVAKRVRGRVDTRDWPWKLASK